MKVNKCDVIYLILSTAVVASLPAQIIDRPLASIRLVEPELVTQQQFDIKRTMFENRMGQKINDSVESALREVDTELRARAEIQYF
jgi:hypothetical protein